MSYELLDRLPSVEEFVSVTDAVGWSHAYDPEAIPRLLAGSLRGVMAVHDGRVVGVGRLVGDGAVYFYLQDLAVVPEHQGRGVGSAMLRRLEEWIAAQGGPKCFTAGSPWAVRCGCTRASDTAGIRA